MKKVSIIDRMASHKLVIFPESSCILDIILRDCLGKGMLLNMHGHKLLLFINKKSRRQSRQKTLLLQLPYYIFEHKALSWVIVFVKGTKRVIKSFLQFNGLLERIQRKRKYAAKYSGCGNF